MFEILKSYISRKVEISDLFWISIHSVMYIFMISHNCCLIVMDNIETIWILQNLFYCNTFDKLTTNLLIMIWLPSLQFILIIRCRIMQPDKKRLSILLIFTIILCALQHNTILNIILKKVYKQWLLSCYHYYYFIELF